MTPTPDTSSVGSVSSVLSNPELKEREYELILDRSGSMKTPDMDGKKRWDALGETAFSVASKLEELSPEGIALTLFSTQARTLEHVKAASVQAIFRDPNYEPNGSTALHVALASRIDSYFQRKAQGKTKPKGIQFFVATDGQPDNAEKVAQVIVNTTKKLTNGDEINITFVQVGHDDGASAYLNRLDDDLTNEGAKYDIVDTLTVEAMGAKSMTQVILDAVLEHKQH